MTPEGFMQDAQGNLVRISNVKPEDILESELVERLVRRAQDLHADLAAFKQEAFKEAYALVDLILDKYDVQKGGKKGNMTFRSFDGSAEVTISVSETLAFGPALQAAKVMIDDCLEEWSDGASDNIRTLILHAFQVNKEGRIDTKRVLALRQLNITDPKWLKAMDAVSDAVRVHSSTTYMRFYQAGEDTGRLDPIVLSFAGIDHGV